ncbi:ninja-family protein mc410-like, partial [Trifolium medium]|nr:ninja-family protein mc410-like [Trifolium medium]
MHVMPPTATGERTGPQSVSNGSLPMMFGHPYVQLPMLDKDSSWGRPQQFHPSFAGRAPTNS